ncbi:Bestrophin-1 [Chionoecetes opilio]|uniref:Bestrophin homolog n=1 Tax=Chionoecetes opilio TaxID=41210 RepID=A0A8J5CHV6_CHIOP|nr:Bestrophin-1 [Chionoecetes opilio]
MAALPKYSDVGRGGVFSTHSLIIILFVRSLIMNGECSFLLVISLTVSTIYVHRTSSEVFEKVTLHVSHFRNLIPISFVLGFYVSVIVTRWWGMYVSMPWPDTLAILLANHIHGQLSGEYGMGYCYGNIKTHKPGNKLRPIISQIPTPTYHLAKKLCVILTPYTPNAYSLQSALEFLDLLKTHNASGAIASLDVESLFTNVPVDRTINYIIDRVYNNDSYPLA